MVVLAQRKHEGRVASRERNVRTHVSNRMKFPVVRLFLKGSTSEERPSLRSKALWTNQGTIGHESEGDKARSCAKFSNDANVIAERSHMSRRPRTNTTFDVITNT